jgi:hypothetical protein
MKLRRDKFREVRDNELRGVFRRVYDESTYRRPLPALPVEPVYMPTSHIYESIIYPHENIYEVPNEIYQPLQMPTRVVHPKRKFSFLN